MTNRSVSKKKDVGVNSENDIEQTDYFLIGRDKTLFELDMVKYDNELKDIISQANILVLGGAGSIGQAVTKEIFKRNPKKLHIVDISENNMVELVRDIRSSLGYIEGDFQTFALDIGSIEYDAFIKADGQYDYVFNLSALKHVRSEKDPFTLMRMIDVNIFYTNKTIQQAIDVGAKKYFCVSTDKAANPVSMMGASKRIMEMFLIRNSEQISISTARFANVAFSDGSLLHGFNQRIQKNQPIAAPNDVKRYFMTPQEAGELCLMSCIFGKNNDIFFPKLNEHANLISFADIAVKYLKQRGYEPYLCKNENEATELAKILPNQGKWPCLFTSSDTSGEKAFEEFFSADEKVDMTVFETIGIIQGNGDTLQYDKKLLDTFEDTINKMKNDRAWTKKEIVELFLTMLPDFDHKETGKYLDGKM